jgi:hypothetical protein
MDISPPKVLYPDCILAHLGPWHIGQITDLFLQQKTAVLAENLIRLIEALFGDANGSGIRLVGRGMD